MFDEPSCEVIDRERTQSPQPLVSVIVPTYNYGAYIADALESLRRQTYANWECVVVDDGSTDNTADIVAAYCKRDSRLKYSLQRETRRQAVAKNIGLQMSSGRYIQFLDADDLLEARKLERQVAYLEARPEVDIVYGGVRYFHDGETERLYSMFPGNQPWMPEVSGCGTVILEYLVRSNIMVISSPLVRRNLIERVGLFDERLPPAEDWDYWLRCALAGARFQFADLDGTLAIIRIHRTSSSQNRVLMHKVGLAIRKKLAGSIESEQIRRLNRELRAQEERDFALLQSRQGNSLNAAPHLIKSAWFEDRPNWRRKLFVLGFVAPFVGPQTLIRLMVSSIRQIIQPGSTHVMK
jgi:GT2 family glycosyltransferase